MAPPKAGFNVNPQNINRKGRPKNSFSFTGHIKKLLEKNPELANFIAKKVLHMATEGDFNAIKLIWSYMDGNPPQGVYALSEEEKQQFLHIYRPEKDPPQTLKRNETKHLAAASETGNGPETK